MLSEEESGLQVDEIVTLVRAYHTTYDQRSKKIKIRADRWSITPIFEIELPELYALDKEGKIITAITQSPDYEVIPED